MPSRRLQLLLFALSFITFSWFHQGGGWNQNARFAEVRALVEEGRLAVDDYMVYRPVQGRKMVREHVENAEFIRDGKVHRLCWGDNPWDYNISTVNGRPLDDGVEQVVIGWDTCTGDVGWAPDRHFHPNKPPGSSLLAVPAYFILYHAERRLGLDADDWWVMSVNAWLCSALTVGLASALGVVLVLRLAAQLFPGSQTAAVGAAVAFGFGTTFFPFSTLMFDHNMTAVLLLAAFSSARSGRSFSAGAWSGVAAVTNYLAAIPGAMFGVWLLCGRGAEQAGTLESGERRLETGKGGVHGDVTPVSDQHSSRRCRLHWGSAARFTLGVLPCLIALLAYNHAAFGSPFALNTSFQNPVFKETAPAFLGMFTWPSWFAALAVTISPWRGVFVLAPVLILPMALLLRGTGMEKLKWERRIILCCAAYFFLINISFNGFHGGYAAGPRYLIPALPFVCIPLALAFVRWPRLTLALAAVSVVQQTLLTVTDALNPLGVGAHAWVNRPDEWKDKLAGNSLVWRYAWPLFSRGRAWPVVDAKFEEWMQGQKRKLVQDGVPGEVMEARLAAVRSETWGKIERGEQEPLWIAAIPGPVSANVLGPWDGTYFQRFPAHSMPADWAAFNVGEFLFPQSRWSVAPLLGMWIAGAFGIRRCLRRR
jgi:hypothetical protein